MPRRAQKAVELKLIKEDIEALQRQEQNSRNCVIALVLYYLLEDLWEEAEEAEDDDDVDEESEALIIMALAMVTNAGQKRALTTSLRHDMADILMSRYYASRNFYMLKNHGAINQAFYPNYRQYPADFHMSSDSFHKLLDRIRHHEVFQNNSPNARKQLDVKHQLLIFLQRVCHNKSEAEVAHLCAVSTGIVHKCMDRVLQALVDLPDTISWPSANERREHASRAKLKGTIGYIDGTDFRLRYKPEEHSNRFVSYKREVCVKLLAACNDNKEIILLLSPRHGSLHDGRIYASLALDPLFSEGERQFFVGDKAFPLSEHMVAPFKGHNLPEWKTKFNQILSGQRVAIENTFALLKNRFQILKDLPFRIRRGAKEQKDLDKIGQLILALGTIHNFLMREGTREDREFAVEHQEELHTDQGAVADDRRAIPVADPIRLEAGKRLRNELARQLVGDLMPDEENL